MNDYDAAQLASVRDPDESRAHECPGCRRRLYADARQGPEDLLPGMLEDSDLIGGSTDTTSSRGPCPGPAADDDDEHTHVGPRDGCTFLHRHECAGSACDGSKDVPEDGDPFADPDPAAGGLDNSPGPWFIAGFDSDCARGCGGIEEGEEARAVGDGSGEHECRACVETNRTEADGPGFGYWEEGEL